MTKSYIEQIESLLPVNLTDEDYNKVMEIVVEMQDRLREQENLIADYEEMCRRIEEIVK